MNHTHFLQAALAQATLGRGFCSPNPAVGAVLVKDNQIIASGFHRGAGTAHAEVNALSNVDDAAGTILYVTLEPCCHQGRTPPCTAIILEKNIPHVVFGFKDPVQHTKTCGEDVLKKAGIRCEYVDSPEINAFYTSFTKTTKTQKPFVTAKLAMSLDGKIAGKEGEPISITGEALSTFTHTCRREADAILTTVKTVVNDDPQLNARTSDGEIKKPVYVVDARLEMPETCRLFDTTKSITVFYDEAYANKLPKKAAVTYVPVKRSDSGLDGEAMFDYLGSQGVHDVWVEAGGEFFSSIVRAGLVDRAYLYVAAKLLGTDAYPAFNNAASLFQTAKEKQWRLMGDDVMCVVEW